jgi:RNA polymerase sigma factor (sigma-70 family)
VDVDWSADSLDVALDQARTGDSRGFEVLYQAYCRAVVEYLRARRVADPDDLANEVFVRAFGAIHTVRGDTDRFRSWLFGIAHNAAVDDLRRRGRRPYEVVLDDEYPVVGGDVETEALARIDEAFVTPLLDRLSPDQRDVILLRVIGELSISQTAAVVDKSYEGVKALQRRAIGSLRRILDGDSAAWSMHPISPMTG